MNDEKETVKDAAAENSAEIDLKYKDKKEWAKGGILGFFIGLAVIVPGVSGSAVAIILRLYEKLLYAFGNILKKFVKCAKFLLPIAVGGVIGFVGGFFGVKKLVEILPFAVVALFAGLMSGAYTAVTGEIRGEKITPPRAALFIIGLLVPVIASCVSVFLTGGERTLDNLTAWHYVLFLLLGYLVAITQLVPGLSATALLMIFGYFKAIMNSVSLTYWKSSPQAFIVYACLAVGFLVGIVTVAKFMSGLLEKHRVNSFFCICGLSLGAIITMFFNPDICAVYRAGLGVWEILLGVTLFVGGLVLSYSLANVENKKKKSI